MESEKLGKLVLSTGDVFEGILRGATHRKTTGEVVFTTGMTGYQETLTDPSYCEQVVVFTPSHIGNTGVNPWDMESARVQVAGVVIHDLCETPSSWRSHGSLSQWLHDAEVPVLTGVSTRELTLRLRDQGVTLGWMGPRSQPDEEVLRLLSDTPSMHGRNLVKVVSTRTPYLWREGSTDLRGEPVLSRNRWKKNRVAVLDFGVKFSILRQWIDAGLEVMVFPATTKAEDLKVFSPHGLFLSNGPGDPGACGDIVENLRSLLGTIPIFGICMGHQLLAQSLGAKTYKLPFGHRGINHPVKNLKSGKVEITTQNHGFAVDINNLPAEVDVTHLSLNDQTCEGIRSTKYPAFSVQYHPESFPGPHDSGYLFYQFVESMQL